LFDKGNAVWSGIRESNPFLILGKDVLDRLTNPAIKVLLYYTSSLLKLNTFTLRVYTLYMTPTEVTELILPEVVPVKGNTTKNRLLENSTPVIQKLDKTKNSSELEIYKSNPESGILNEALPARSQMTWGQLLNNYDGTVWKGHLAIRVEFDINGKVIKMHDVRTQVGTSDQAHDCYEGRPIELLDTPDGTKWGRTEESKKSYSSIYDKLQDRFSGIVEAAEKNMQEYMAWKKENPHATSSMRQWRAITKYGIDPYLPENNLSYIR
jgi:hypothetical protein